MKPGGLEHGAQAASIIMEGFICPECQQDMTNLELLQAHFELVHSGNKSNKRLPSNGAGSRNGSHANGEANDSSKSGFSNVFAKAKTLINSLDQGNDDDSTNPFLTSSASSSAPNGASSTSSAQQSNPVINPSNVSYSFMKQYFNSNQTPGLHRSHTSEFKKMRDNTIGRYVVQTNKLLIALDKLVSIDLHVFSDESKRDTHFKSVVPWIDDKDVHLCPNCAKGFNLLSRKHHCRLCGAIMCNKCSQFISFTLAKQITDPDLFIRSNSNNNQTEFKLKRSDSITSVNSYFFKTTSNDSSANENGASLKGSDKRARSVSTDQVYIRLCVDCGRVLEKKYNLLKDKIIRPTFDNLYDDLRFAILESQRLHPVYKKMSESLYCGEAIYQLSNAEEMRTKLIRLYQQVDVISNSILKNGINQESAADANNNSSSSATITVCNDQFKLQRNLRLQAVNFLKEYSFTLPQLPSAKDYEQLKSRRQLHLIEEMKRREMEQLRQRKQIDDQVARNQYKAKPKLSAQQRSITIDNVNGWVPSKPNIVVEDLDRVSMGSATNEGHDDRADPTNAVRIQIQLVEGYLNDAIKNNKIDEARILEKNLNDLLDMLEIKN